MPQADRAPGAASSRPQAVGAILRAPKTAELIAGHLRRQIVRGELAAHANLPSEAQLMEQFGVSRPTLREAYRILEAEAVLGVRRGARGGAQVLHPGPQVAARHVGLLLQLQGATIRDVYDARLVSEPVCARLLARGRTEQDLADLRALVAELEGLLADGGAAPEAGPWSAGTSRFHQLVMERCGNRTLAVQNAVLADIIDTHVRLAIDRDTSDAKPIRFGRSIRSYQRLVELVADRDAAGAEAHWRAHMEAAATYLFADSAEATHVVDLFG